MKPSEMARIGDRLKSFREKINLSQTEFAEKCKINVVQYRRYENNSSIPREEQLNKIINAFAECGLEITKFDLIPGYMTPEELQSAKNIANLLKPTKNELTRMYTETLNNYLDHSFQLSEIDYQRLTKLLKAIKDNPIITVPDELLVKCENLIKIYEKQQQNKETVKTIAEEQEQLQKRLLTAYEKLDINNRRFSVALIESLSSNPRNQVNYMPDEETEGLYDAEFQKYGEKTKRIIKEYDDTISK